MAVTLRQTPGNHQLPALTLLFIVGKLENHLDAFIGSILDKTAGIDDYGIGVFGVLYNGPAGLFDAAQHDFAVYLVSGTS
jgi:hypothetical protein